jgi:hypothetical protein
MRTQMRCSLPKHPKLPRLKEGFGQCMNLTRFRAELDDEIYRQRVREHQQAGRKHNLRGSPAFLINGVVQDISADMDLLAARLKSELKRVTGNSSKRPMHHTKYPAQQRRLTG